MKPAGSKTSEDQKKILAVVGFALLAGLVLYFELRDPTPPTPSAPVAVAAPAVSSGTTSSTSARTAVGDAAVGPPGNVVRGSGPSAKEVGTSSAALDPTLHMEAMLVTESLVYTGSGRNIFSATSVPVAVPKPIAPARPVAPTAPRPQVVVDNRPQTCPPQCPPIDMKFFGTATTANGSRQAFLLHGEDVFLASAGDIVLRRYRIVAIDANSIQVEDMPNSNKQTLPLLAN